MPLAPGLTSMLPLPPGLPPSLPYHTPDLSFCEVLKEYRDKITEFVIASYNNHKLIEKRTSVFSLIPT